MEPIVSVAGIKERDIDLLLLEEFVASVPFLHWFLQKIGEGNVKDWQLVSGARSVTQSQGESDLEIFVNRPEGNKLAVLIENKINAAVQPEQAERYEKRGRNYIRNGRCSEFRVVLCAPSNYMYSTTIKGFTTKVVYEDLLAWFNDKKGSSQRSFYKSVIIANAIEKAVLGYQQVEDAPVTTFWDKYWSLVQRLAPELNMNKPGGRPATSRFFYFLPRDLPKGTKIVHKALQARVDLQFRGMGERIEDLEAIFSECLDPDMTIRKANKAGVVRIQVKSIDVGDSFEEQLEDIKHAVLAAKRLLSWWDSNKINWKG